MLEPPGPLPCAAQNGTTFIVDDLFYNNEQRRKVLMNDGLPKVSAPT